MKKESERGSHVLVFDNGTRKDVILGGFVRCGD